MKGLIVDDAQKARTLLRLMLAEYAPDVEVIGEAENVEQANNLIEHFSPDVLFLDIEMPGKSGLQLAEQLKNNHFKGSIVFITAYNEHALKAFRLSAIDYLLKPLQEQHLIEALDKLREKHLKKEFSAELDILQHNLTTPTAPKIAIPIVGGIDYLLLNEIRFIEADGAYIRIHLTTSEIKVYSKNLKYIENALEGQTNFIRVHRTYIVNRDCVQRLLKGDNAFLGLNSGEQIPISRERKQSIYNLFH